MSFDPPRVGEQDKARAESTPTPHCISAVAVTHRRLRIGGSVMPKFRTLDDLKVAGKRVLVRCDLNVPMKDDKVTDATRIERSAETLKALSAKGAQVIGLSHCGRPKG